MDARTARNLVIREIDKASVEPAHWPVVLESISNLVGARAATLMYRNKAPAGGRFPLLQPPA
ncbi:MAG: hypothetical protein U5K33_01470 [Halofilum sp. (in: g-proteobacteria)]|nr:hypothetical protein [Halofilum sp. (in: g-proteobacteria)]